MIDGWNLVRYGEEKIFRQVIEFTDSQRRIEQFCNRDGIRRRLFLTSGRFDVLRERVYAISLYRHDVCIYGGSRVQIDIFIPEGSQFPALSFSPFRFLGATIAAIA